jgi:hypothetical protein
MLRAGVNILRNFLSEAERRVAKQEKLVEKHSNSLSGQRLGCMITTIEQNLFENHESRRACGPKILRISLSKRTNQKKFEADNQAN